MSRTTKYTAPLFAAAAIGAIGLAPVASANTSPAPVPHSTAAPGSASAPAPYVSKIGPLLPRGTDAGVVPYYFPGMLSLVS